MSDTQKEKYIGAVEDKYSFFSLARLDLVRVKIVGMPRLSPTSLKMLHVYRISGEEHRVGYNAASRTSFKWVNEERIQERREVDVEVQLQIVLTALLSRGVRLDKWYPPCKQAYI